MTTSTKALLFLWATLLVPDARAAADGLRVVVLAKVAADGKPGEAASLESAAIAALREKGARVVELSAALAAQRAALSDAVAGGKVPSELSALNADVALSVQLACAKGAGTYGCALAAKAVRVDSGDVVLAASAELPPGALTAADAVRLALAGKGAAELKAQVEQLVAAPASFALDLSVTGLPDRDRASALAPRMAKAPGVKSARMAVFGRVTKYALELEGPGARGALLDALGQDAETPLKITYETERLVHASYDFDRANLRPLAVWFDLPTGAAKSKLSAVRDGAAAIFGSALRNLGTFQVGAVRPLPAALARKDSRAALAQLAKDAAPGSLLLLCRISASGPSWLATLELAGPKAPGVLASATASALEPLDAVDLAVRKLDQAWRDALGRPATRALLSLSAAPGAPEPIAIEAFEAGQVFPARLPRYQKEGVGRLVLKNRSAAAVSGGRVRFSLGPAVLSDAPLADLAPGASVTLPVRLDALPEGEGKDRYRQLVAQVTFASGESYGRVDAYAPLVVQDANAVDWSAPESLAAFVDPSDKVVRALASKALGDKREGGIAPSSRDAARILSSLWKAPLQYVADPVSIAFSAEVDTVQSPSQTLARLAGDCDDLTVLLASLFESVGISSAVVLVPGHVLPAVDAGVLSGGHVLYGLPRSAFVEVDGQLFIPLESTAVGAGFGEAWQAATRTLRAAKGKVQAFRVRSAWRAFPTVPLASAKPSRLEATAPAEGPQWPKILSAVAAAAKDPVPAWSTELSRKLLAHRGSEPIVLEASPPASDPLANAALSYLAAATDRGMPTAAQACARGSAEACYDLAVMLSLDDVEGASETKASLAEAALGSLPPNLAGMLVDAGATLGDEASEEAAAKRRLNELLRAVQQHADEQRAKRGWSGKVEQLATAGRRGAKVQPKSAALMFFWAPVTRP